MITLQEKKVIDITAELWNEFLILPVQCQDDITDFKFHIHALQNILLGRPALRELKKLT